MIGSRSKGLAVTRTSVIVVNACFGSLLIYLLFP